MLVTGEEHSRSRNITAKFVEFQGHCSGRESSEEESARGMASSQHEGSDRWVATHPRCLGQS